MIRTLKSLDREAQAKHELLVGTEENDSQTPGATTIVEVTVDVCILFTHTQTEIYNNM